MLDEDTLVVTYQAWRGEPRGKHKTGESWEGRGHCVDCNQCVAVCPTGIDIRDGIQLECIGCALCIDACNGVMEKLDLPRGLIAYDTERRKAERSEGKKLSYRIVRPRTILYTMLLLGVASFMLVMLATRDDQALNVLRDRTPLFVRLSDGTVRNGFEVKVLNKARDDRRFFLAVGGIKDAAMSVVGDPAPPRATVTLEGRGDKVTAFKVYVRVPQENLKSADEALYFVLTDPVSGTKTRRDVRFRGPRK